MIWVLFMTLMTSSGSSIHTVEFNREEDCWKAAQLWVAANENRRATSITAYCVQK